MESRLSWGITTNIQPPDEDLQYKLIDFYCKREGISLPEKLIEHYNRQSFNNVSELFSTLKNAATHEELTNQWPAIEEEHPDVSIKSKFYENDQSIENQHELMSKNEDPFSDSFDDKIESSLHDIPETSHEMNLMYEKQIAALNEKMSTLMNKLEKLETEVNILKEHK
nr:DnaA/Hda family protein [Fictibacillus gelatini]